MAPDAGLALLGEFSIGLGLLEALDKSLPPAGSGAGYRASEHKMPLILMLDGGGRSLEDLCQIRDDQGLWEVLALEHKPSSDATGEWLRRSGVNSGLEGLDKFNRKALKRGLKYDGIKAYTLDIAATRIEAEKQSAKMTYKGYTGYMPMVGHLAENGLVVGNESPAAGNLEFIKYCEQQLPKSKHIKAFRADSATYQAQIINYCHDNGIEFAIGALLDQAVVRAIKSLADRDWHTYQNGFIAERVHCMNKTRQAFRLVVIRRRCQGKLFDRVEEVSERYTVIATNRREQAEQVISTASFYGQIH